MNLEQLASRLGDQLIAWYGVRREEVRFVFSPYRICPLGAHIDHQLGRVTAMALDRGILLAFAPSKLPELRVRSLDFHGEVAFSFGDVGPPRQGDWGNYPRGAVLALQKDFALNYGYFGATAGRIAEGGLSSSAAVGVAYLKALEQVNGLEVTTEKNIDLVQQIENTYLGLRIGILDQSAILLSRANMLTVIDCHDVSSSLISRAEHAPDFDILIAASGLRESLVSTDYNQRVAECEQAARQLLEAAGRPETPAHLRNVTPHQYRQFRTALEGPPARRAAHFFSEMKRVDQGIEAWKQGDLMTFGKLITESGIVRSEITSVAHHL